MLHFFCTYQHRLAYAWRTSFTSLNDKYACQSKFYQYLTSRYRPIRKAINIDIEILQIQFLLQKSQQPFLKGGWHLLNKLI